MIVCPPPPILPPVLSTQLNVESQMKLIARPMYSNPPLHGALLVSKILQDKALKAMWYLVRGEEEWGRRERERELCKTRRSRRCSTWWVHVWGRGQVVREGLKAMWYLVGALCSGGGRAGGGRRKKDACQKQCYVSAGGKWGIDGVQQEGKAMGGTPGE